MVQAKKSKLKVVMLSKCDHSSSGWKFCCAIRKYTDIDIKLIKVRRNYAGDEQDLLLSPTSKEVNMNHTEKTGLHTLDKLENFEEAQALVDSADVVWFKDDNPPIENWFGVHVDLNNKPIMNTVSGSLFRRKGKVKKVAYNLYNVKDFLERSLTRTAITPDLNYPDYQGMYLPHCYDSEGTKFTWKKEENEMVHIFTTPSSPVKKGIPFLRLAIKKLREEGFTFNYEEVSGVTRAESIERKSKATLFFDQITTGAYGVSAIEAMAMGIPVVSFLSKQAMMQSDGLLSASCPVINTEEYSVNGVYKAIKSFLLLEDKLDLARRTKLWCDTMHGEKVSAIRASYVIRRTLERFNEKEGLEQVSFENVDWGLRLEPENS